MTDIQENCVVNPKNRGRKIHYRMDVPAEYFGAQYIPTPQQLMADDPEIDILALNQEPKEAKVNPETLTSNLRG